MAAKVALTLAPVDTRIIQSMVAAAELAKDQVEVDPDAGVAERVALGISTYVNDYHTTSLARARLSHAEERVWSNSYTDFVLEMHENRG